MTYKNLSVMCYKVRFTMIRGLRDQRVEQGNHAPAKLETQTFLKVFS